ncbi:hypothetical protein SLEP1_g48723 [Rubroshorea leprosula]|uniref:NB-ARC domain-containing protein n=1 Tax=Rubroshorea leprosula TaxID=152421 RepID=A0AAV5LUJ2_9ROSI|nr:hypothetical protein SLEP1_g48723 [Rubroshorea leprosula]
MICKGGCFTYICSSRKLDKETQALEVGILKRGEKYTNTGAILVMDDHSIQSRVSVFEDKQKEVKQVKEKIEVDLQTQLRQPGKIAWNKVEDWLKKASQQVTMKVEGLISQGECSSSTNVEEKIEELKQECSSSTNIEEKTEELKQTLEEGKEFTNVGVSLVIDDHSKKGVTMLAEKCIARDDVQEEILQLLRGDKVTRIAVCGMGGVGKTTIMQQFDILKFQKSIARKLQLDLKNADQDEIELAGLIADRLQQGSHVLILDDVWEPFSLEHVGIPDLVGNNGCKLVLTTRLQQEVGRAMECEVIPVMPLPDDEALALFLDKVGSEVVSYPRYKSDIEPFLNQILKKYEELSKSKEIVDRLKFSYDHLEEQYKKCFLYCALYPEDHYIQQEELIEFWIDEGFITDEKGSRHLMTCEGHSIIQKLIDNCMLESVKEVDEEYMEVRLHEMIKVKNKDDWVSMHDLLREMVLNIIHPQFMVKAGMALEELPEEVEGRKNLLKVSLMENQIREFPSSMLSPKCPMLTTLLLSKNNITTIPEAFFYHMPGLKILDLSGNHNLLRLPSSVFKLESLTTLLLENCESLEEVPFLSNLGGLKKLNLYGTSIKELPQGLNMLTKLKYLWLGGMLSDIPNGLLRNLSKLQYLGVDLRIPLKWEEIGRLSKLESLDGRLSTLDDMTLFAKSERKFLNQYTISVGSYSPRDSCLYNKTFSNVMKSIVCCHIDICEEPNWLPSDAQDFYILDCKDVRSLDDISGFQQATDLRHCTVDRLVGAVEAVAKSAPLPAGTFSSLQKIQVWGCEEIKKLLPLRLLQYLQNLQTIEVIHCHQMEEIIWSEYEEEGEKALEKLTLPKLERLVLKALPALNSIYSGSTTVLIYNLKSLFDEEVLGLSTPPTNFFTLKTINVSACFKLKKVFSSELLLGYFQSLETIEVYLCGQMEELISSSTYEEKEALEKITLPKLQRLELSRLPELKSICSSSSVLICDSMNALLIRNCKKLKKIPLHLSSLDNGQPPSLKQIGNTDIEEEEEKEEMYDDDNNDDDEEEESLRMG